MRLRRNAIFAVVEVAASGIALFFIYRNVVQTLGISSLGIWSLVLATTAFGRVADIGISSGLARFIARSIAENAPDRAIIFMRTGAISVATIMGVVSLLAWYPLWVVLSWSLGGEELQEARAVLPWALLTFWLLNLKAVLDACLLGLQRGDLRSIGSLVGIATQVVASLALVGHYGLFGLAWAQAGQYIPALGLALLFLKYISPSFRNSSVRTWFSWPVFKELMGFGVKLQIGTMANLMFEPVCKMVLAGMAGTAVLGTFEMAYRMVYQVRSVAIMALQTTVPEFAELDAKNSDKLPQFFVKVCRTAALATAPLMILTIVASPFVSWLWVGSINPQFIFLCSALSIGWSINILSAPAYFLGMADGRVAPNVIGQILSGLLAPILVYILGSAYGGLLGALGVAIGKIPGDLLPAFLNRPCKSWRHSVVLNVYCIVSFISVSVVALAMMFFYWRML